MDSMNFPTISKHDIEDSSEDDFDSDDVESPDTSSTKDSDTGVEQDYGKSTEQDDIAAQESVGVSRWRRMVCLMLLLTAALVITSTYMFLSREETDEFEKSVSFSMVEIYSRRWSVATQQRPASDQNYIMQH
jgi:hypothetical protein